MLMLEMGAVSMASDFRGTHKETSITASSSGHSQGRALGSCLQPILIQSEGKKCFLKARGTMVMLRDTVSVLQRLSVH